ncbi:efflux RND transporter periplasmic adaptor subunit [soil metagenome]
MRLTSGHYLSIAAIVAAGVGGYFIWQGMHAAPAKPAKAPVQIVKTSVAAKKPIPITITSNGYVTAIETVDVRPQVQNVVRAVHVKEGQDVRAGQLLFTLDERSDLSNVDKARAQIARDRADLTEAEMNLKRNQELVAKNFVSSAVVDTARAKVESLRATLRADEAATQSSNVQLSYNRISASISGRIGSISVHPGSLAQPTGPAMLTISQLDPISIAFSVPERELSAIRTTYPNGGAPVTAQLGEGRELVGKLVFIDSGSDSQSGTIKLKAEFANKGHPLWPGAYVNVRMVSRTLTDAVVIPAQAVVTGPVEQFVYVVEPDEVVKIQKIQVVAIEEGQAAVTGLAAGARVVVEGSQNLRPGSKVKEMQIDKAGTSKTETNKSGTEKAEKKAGQ